MDTIRNALQCDNASVTGAGVRIAVIDTGIDDAHLDLIGCVNLEASACGPGFTSLKDRDGHGTHIAGIAGSGTASRGVYRGIAPGAELIVLKSTRGRGLDHDIAWAVGEAIARDVDIINYSGTLAMPAWPPPWTWARQPSALDAMFARAVDRGILCVAAAGNHGPQPGSVMKPGLNPDVLCVGATTKSLVMWKRSSRGPVRLDPALRKGAMRTDSAAGTTVPLIKPDVVAPGAENDDSPLPNPVSARSQYSDLIPEAGFEGHYTAVGGTSQATAVLSGLAALALELGNQLGVDWGTNTGSMLRRILMRCAVPLETGTAHDYGHGVMFWPNIEALIGDCVRSPDVRAGVAGPVLRLL